MKNSILFRIGGAAALAVALSVAPLAMAGTDVTEPQYGDDYEAGDYARIRHAANGATILRSERQESSPSEESGGVNSPIFPGDAVASDSTQRIEVQLAGGTLVWLDRNTEAVFLALPDPYAEVADNAILQLTEGALRLASVLDDDQELRVDTPSATVYPLGDASLRIEVDRGDRTFVVSRSGVAEVVGSGGSVILRAGMATEVSAGSMPVDPRAVSSFDGDGFDRWVAGREDEFRYRDGYAEGRGEAYDEIPDEVRPYYRELSVHGRWVNTPDYGYVWSPHGIDDDWRPYYDGYWSYGPRGYFWVSHEPWGWAPYHYGRWTWIGSQGWCWSPGRVFAGAWVAWSWGSVHVGWSALDYWGYPSYRTRWHHGYYDPYAWTFVGYSHLHHRHYNHYRVRYDHIQHDLHRSAVVTRPPRVSPHRLSQSPRAREAAFREARDGSRRLAPIDREHAERRSFRRHDERVARGGSGEPRRGNAPEVRTGRAGRLPERGRQRGRSEARTDRRPAASDRLPVITQPRFPREKTPSREGRRGTGGAERPKARKDLDSPRGRRGAEPLGSSERLRKIFSKMSQPRQTRDAPRRSSGRDGSGQEARPPQRSGGEKARPAPKGPSSGSKKSPPRATPKPPRKRDDRSSALGPAGGSRDRRGGERARPRQPSTGPRTPANRPGVERGGSSGGRQPGARQGQDRTRKPTAGSGRSSARRPSASSSNGPAPRRPSARSGGGNRAPQPRAGNRGGGSTPKPRVGGNRGGGNRKPSSGRSGRGGKRR